MEITARRKKMREGRGGRQRGGDATGGGGEGGGKG